MTRARQRLVLSGAAELEGWTGNGATGGGPIAWIAPALIPELGERIAEGGGVVIRDGVPIGLRIADPADVAASPVTPPAPPAAGGPDGPPVTLDAPPDAPPLGAPPPDAPPPGAPPPGRRRRQSRRRPRRRLPELLDPRRVCPLRVPLLRRTSTRAAPHRGNPDRGARPAGGPAQRSGTERGVLIHALLRGLTSAARRRPDRV